MKTKVEPTGRVLEGTVAFTGRLASMSRAEAFALIRSRGGTPRQGVTRQTDILVVGELGWPLVDDGRPSNSLARARTYGIPITSERQFLEWIGRGLADEQNKAYTADQLSALSKVPKDILEQLAIFGLIEPKGDFYGFRDLAAARQIAGLLKSGIALSVITRSLHEIRKWLPDARLSNLRLFPESSDRILVEQMKGRADKTGQFVLPVTAPGDDLDALFQNALVAEETGDAATAEQLYRRMLKAEPADADALFNLGNLLRSLGRAVEAEAVYRDATKTAPHFPEVWYNLAELFDDQGRAAEAVAALECAIKADPDYADALFNLALLLQRLERHAEAAAFWKRYLRLDAHSPWSVRAKRALKYCEMKLAGF
ncbi:MAG: tetratricopeptide repeat protein [Xanthobacteraceae bacterium]